MGSIESLLPRVDKSFPYFCVVFYRTDRLFLLHCNKTTEEIIKSRLKRWDTDLSLERITKRGSKAIKLNAHPWRDFHSNNEKRCTKVKEMLCDLLTDLAEAGWRVANSADLSTNNDGATWFFEQNIEEVREGIETVCVSLNDSNVIQLVNGSPELRDILKESINRYVREEKIRAKNYELTVSGKPWAPEKRIESVIGRRLLLKITRAFLDNGFKFAARFTSREHPDTIFFQKISKSDMQKSTMFMLSLHERRILRIIDSDSKTTILIKQAAETLWANDTRFKDYREEHHSDIKLDGSPWLADEGRVFVCRLLEQLSAAGWFLHCSFNMSVAPNEKLVMILAKSDPAPSPYLALYPIEDGKLHIVHGDKDLTQELSRIVSNYWPVVLKKTWLKSSRYEVSEVLELELLGKPWVGEEPAVGMVTRHLMMALLIGAKSLGLTLAASVGFVSEFGDVYMARDCWMFAQNPKLTSEENERKMEGILESFPHPEHYEGAEAEAAVRSHLTSEGDVHITVLTAQI